MAAPPRGKPLVLSPPQIAPPPRAVAPAAQAVVMGRPASGFRSTALRIGPRRQHVTECAHTGAGEVRLPSPPELSRDRIRPCVCLRCVSGLAIVRGRFIRVTRKLSRKIRVSRKNLTEGDKKAIGFRLKLLREHAGLGQAEAAERLDLGRHSTLASYE